MKKLLVMLMALIMMFSVASAAMAEEPVTITVCVGWSESSLPNWEALAEKFEQENPNINIEIQWAAADMDKLMAQFISGDAPDICQTWKYAFNDFVDAGLITELTDMYAENGWTDIYDGVAQWVAPMSQVTEEEVQIYGVPDFINTSVIFYNTDIFAQYNIAEPTNLDELIAAAQTLNENGVAPLAYCGAKTNIVDIMAKILCQTTPMSTLMDIYFGEQKWTEETCVQAMEIFQKLVETGVYSDKFLAYDDDQAYTAFANGEAAMYAMHTGYNTNLIGLQKENPDFHFSIMKGVNFVDEPVTPYSATFGANWIIPTSCKHPEEAKQVLSYLFDLESATEAARDYGRITMFPEANKEITAPSTMVVVENQMATLDVNSFYLIDMMPSSVLDAMAAGMQEMIMGNMNAQEVMEYTQEAMDIVVSER